jgi:DNA-binding transcriptional MerR regulator
VPDDRTIAEQRLSISEVAEATGLTTHTLRYYERAGLLPGVERASSTHRRYSATDVGLLVFISRLRATSMPIAKVREYMELVRRGESTTEHRLELLLRHRIAVVAQLAEMQGSLEAIDHKIDLYRSMNQKETAR